MKAILVGFKTKAKEVLQKIKEVLQKMAKWTDFLVMLALQGFKDSAKHVVEHIAVPVLKELGHRVAEEFYGKELWLGWTAFHHRFVLTFTPKGVDNIAFPHVKVGNIGGVMDVHLVAVPKEKKLGERLDIDAIWEGLKEAWK